MRRLGDDRLVQVEEGRPHRVSARPTGSWMASSASAVTSTSTSSPTARRVSPRGTIRWSSRTTATTVASRGTPRSTRAVPAAGESSARVTSTRWALPPSNRRRRTRLPTDTASSTRAVSSCGVDTETSTPQVSVKSHWFFGWFTRATTRGTANSCLASRETTRLSSSSPVAATTTSTVARPAASRADTSQASATTQVMSRSPADAGHQFRVLLDDQHLVAAGVEVARRWRCPRCPLRRWPPSSPASGSAVVAVVDSVRWRFGAGRPAGHSGPRAPCR